MKKGIFGRVTALFLSLVMVAVMVPVGSLVVFAEVADVDVDAAEVIIDSVADWKAVATSGKDFDGQTVKLGADIAFGSEAAPVLFATFKGTFLGNGKTVSGTAMAGKNLIATTVDGGIIDGENMTISGFTVTSTEKSDSFAIVAGQIKNKATVKNITAMDCKVKVGADSNGSASCAIIVAQVMADTDDSPYSNSSFVFDEVCSVIENCTVTNCVVEARVMSGMVLGNVNSNSCIKIIDCEVNGTSSILTHQAATGMIIGKLNANTYAKVSDCTVASTTTIKNNGVGNYWGFAIGMIVGQTGTNGSTKGQLAVTDCNVAGTIIPASGSTAGGVVGSINFSGNNEIKGCAANVVFQLNQGNLSVGGILGNYHGCSAGSLTISKCKATGEINDVKSAGGSPRMAGILGRGQGTTTGKTVIEQCYADVDVSASSTYDKLGGIVGEWNTASSSLTVRNCYYEGTVSSAKANAAAIIGTKGSAVTETTVSIHNVVVNSAVETKVSTTSFTNVSDCYSLNSNLTGKGVLAVTNEEIQSNLVKYDANGFIESVNGYVRCGLVQVSNAVDGAYMVRFIGTSIFDEIESAHMKITATLGEDVRVFEADCTAYDILTAHTSATQIANVASESFGAEKFVAITVNGIPAANANEIVFDIDLTVTVGGVDYTASVSDMLIPPVAA